MTLVDIWASCVDCGVELQLSTEALERWRLGNELLEHKGDRPLGLGEIARCEPCHVVWRQRAEQESRRVFLAAREQVRALLRGEVPMDEHTELAVIHGQLPARLPTPFSEALAGEWGAWLREYVVWRRVGRDEGKGRKRATPA